MGGLGRGGWRDWEKEKKNEKELMDTDSSVVTDRVRGVEGRWRRACGR